MVQNFYFQNWSWCFSFSSTLTSFRTEVAFFSLLFCLLFNCLWTLASIEVLLCNRFDCGVFMIKYADFYSRGLGLHFSQVGVLGCQEICNTLALLLISMMFGLSYLRVFDTLIGYEIEIT